MLDISMKFIIGNIYPKFIHHFYWDVEKPINIAFSDVGKYQKLTKYQQTEFSK